MTATIRAGTFEATIDGWEWIGDNASLVEMLNAHLDPEGPSGGDPAPDYHEAQRVADLIGAEVIEFDLPDYVDGRVY